MTVHVVVPTFRESGLVGPFLQSWDDVSSVDLRLHVINGNPGDETSTLLAEWQGRHPLTEHRGHPDLFWTGLVALGLREVSRVAGEGDFFLLTNIDVRPLGDPLESILTKVPSPSQHQVAIPVTVGEGKVTSSAVVVRSWALSLNRHLGEDQEIGELPFEACLEATYLPTRFLLVPVKALSEGHFPDEEICRITAPTTNTRTGSVASATLPFFLREPMPPSSRRTRASTPFSQKPRSGRDWPRPGTSNVPTTCATASASCGSFIRRRHFSRGFALISPRSSSRSPSGGGSSAA